MPTPLTFWGSVEDAIKTRLLATLGEEASPFKARNVVVGLAGMDDESLAELLNTMGDANQMPAALVAFWEADFDGGKGGTLREDAGFEVLVADAGRSRETVVRGGDGDTGVYYLLDFVLNRLHKQVIAGLNNPLVAVRIRRLRNPHVPLTVAMMAVRLQVQNYRADGAY